MLKTHVNLKVFDNGHLIKGITVLADYRGLWACGMQNHGCLSDHSGLKTNDTS